MGGIHPISLSGSNAITLSPFMNAVSNEFFCIFACTVIYNDRLFYLGNMAF